MLMRQRSNQTLGRVRTLCVASASASCQRRWRPTAIDADQPVISHDRQPVVGVGVCVCVLIGFGRLASSPDVGLFAGQAAKCKLRSSHSGHLAGCLHLAGRRAGGRTPHPPGACTFAALDRALASDRVSTQLLEQPVLFAPPQHNRRASARKEGRRSASRQQADDSSSCCCCGGRKSSACERLLARSASLP